MKQFHTTQYHYEMETQRFDCPVENVGEWLNDRAIKQAFRQQEVFWEVCETTLIKQEDGTHIYQVTVSAN